VATLHKGGLKRVKAFDGTIEKNGERHTDIGVLIRRKMSGRFSTACSCGYKKSKRNYNIL